MRLIIAIIYILGVSSTAFAGGNILFDNHTMFWGATTNYTMEFNGSSGYLDLSTVGIANPDSDFTVDAWIKITSTAATVGVVTCNINGAGDNNEFSFELLVVATGKIRGSIAKAGVVPYVTAESVTTINPDTWYLLSAVWDNTGANTGTMTVFLNGSSIATDSNTIADPIDTDYWHIGVRRGSGFGLAGYFPGKIGQVRISNIVRDPTAAGYGSAPFTTDANTLALYPLGTPSETNPIDSTGNTTAVNVGGVTYSTDSPFN